MEEPLAQFLIWWDSEDGKQRAVDEQESVYKIAQRAFFAGHATQPPVPLAPSRDALTAPLNDKQREILRRYQPPQPYAGPVQGRFQVAGPHSDVKPRPRPYFVPREDQVVRFLEPLPVPDYIQQGTVTGRIGPIPAPPLQELPLKHVTTVWNGPDDHEQSPDTMEFRAIEPDEDEYGPRGPVFTPLSGQDG